MEYRLSVVIFHILFLCVDFVVLVNVFRQRNNSQNERVFKTFSVLTVFQEVCCSLVMLSYPELFRMPAALHYMIYICLFVGVTACSCCWYVYLKNIIRGRKRIKTIGKIVIALPLVVMIITAASSPVTHWIFYIDEKGEYQRGSLMILQMLCPYIYFLMGIALHILYGRSEGKERAGRLLRYYIIMVIPSLVCVLIQMLVVRGGFTSIGISIGFLFMYLDFYLEEVNENKRLKSLESLNEQLRRINEEQEKQLEKNIALNTSITQRMNIIQSMGNVYFTSFYINIPDDTFFEVTNIESIRRMVGTQGSAKAAIDVLCNRLVKEEFKELTREFMKLETLDDRMKGRKYITFKYIGATSNVWCQGYLIESNRDENGKLIGVLFATRMIQEEKALEEEQSRILKEAREAAEAASNAKTTFLFNMSHDIRTPMNAIMGFRDLLEKNQEDPVKREDYLRKIKEASDILLSIINNVLEMSRIEKGTVLLEESAWSVEQFADNIHSIFKEMMFQKNIVFNRRIDVQHPYIFCDPIKLREVFINIISNAYKYTNPGGRVDLVTEELSSPRDGYVLYRTTISDTGIGMSEEYMPHVFEEFTRENSFTENKIEGTGLGMSIVKRLLDIMGGTISVSSKKGEGTTFVIDIYHRIAERSDLVEYAGDVMGAELFRGKRILLAEDNNLNAEIAIEILSEAGFEVERAEDGVVCCEKLSGAESGYYNLILMDIQMPNMNGYEATKTIREMEDKSKADIPIIAMTANAFEEDKKEAVRAGMNGHLSKPVNVSELLGTISGILRKK